MYMGRIDELLFFTCMVADLPLHEASECTIQVHSKVGLQCNDENLGIVERM